MDANNYFIFHNTSGGCSDRVTFSDLVFFTIELASANSTEKKKKKIHSMDFFFVSHSYL